MLRIRFFAFLASAVCLFGIAGTAEAAETACNEVYCFSAEDFSSDTSIDGICITSLPDSGTLCLGSRILREGDVLTAEQVARMTFAPVSSEEDKSVEVAYLPIYGDRVAEEAAMTIAIRGREDKAPIAEDSAMETYKNLPNTGKLKVSDPEGQAMTFTVTRQPRRGTVTIGEDGSFTYTPKENKVGIDSFTYTATDPAGKVSREATVTVTILKPSEAAQYTDTLGCSCRFAAEWMKNTGIFVGETVAEKSCFSPEKQVTRGEFVTMLVKTLDIPVDEGIVYTGYTDEIPQWLQPYLAAAVRSGLTAGLNDQETFGADTAITGAEAAVMVGNATNKAVETWAEDGILTRGDAAQMLYEVSGQVNKNM